jgi:tetratricopeptide (TPR) repeat protein
MKNIYVTFIALISCCIGIAIGVIFMHNGFFFFSDKYDDIKDFACTHSNDANAFLLLGLEKYKEKDYIDALFAYNEAILIKPSCLEAYYGIAQYYSDIEKNYNLALQTLKNAEEKNPNSAEEIKRVKLLLDMKFHKKVKNISDK